MIVVKGLRTDPLAAEVNLPSTDPRAVSASTNPFEAEVNLPSTCYCRQC